jgi:DNA-directed RNA polymerase subunit RPC12/RpoP
VQQDYAEAAKWYRKSAEQGFAGAQFGLGLCYQNGLGVSQDSGEAMKWLRSAADQGHGDARDALRQGSSGPQIPSRAGTEVNSGTVRHKCPACGKGLKMGGSAAGKRVPCPGCQTLLEVSADLRMLTVRHKCPACGKSLKMGANTAGRQIPCPACNALLEISGDLKTIVDVTDTGEKIELLDVPDDPGEFGVIDLGELGPDDLSG